MSGPVSKVLIVDDHQAVCTALQLLFELHGIETLAVHGAAAALQVVATEDLAAVVQDMNFTEQKTSGEEGAALFRAIRQLDPELPILLLSAWSTRDTVTALIQEGAHGYMSKPWNDEDLLRAVERMSELRASGRHGHAAALDRRADLPAIVTGKR